MRAWLFMGMWQKLSFFFLFAVTALTIVRAFRLAWWRRWHRARALARSTRGLAQAAFWLTASGGAVGLYTAWIVIENTNRSMLAIIANRTLDVLDATAVGFSLCALLFVVGSTFDLLAAWTHDRVVAAVSFGRGVLVAVALVLTGVALLEIRPAVVSPLANVNDDKIGFAVFDALQHLWAHLAGLFAAIGLLAWLGVLAESSLMRRRPEPEPARRR